MASVVLRPGLPPNWDEGSMLCFSAKKEICFKLRAEKPLGRVSMRPIGRYAVVSLPYVSED